MHQKNVLDGRKNVMPINSGRVSFFGRHRELSRISSISLHKGSILEVQFHMTTTVSEQLSMQAEAESLVISFPC